MPYPSTRLSVHEFEQHVKEYAWTRKITEVHAHHTFRPSRADFEKLGGEAVVRGMYQFHTKTRGWTDFGQHVTIDPKGGVWTGRAWNRAPASARGYNGNSASGPFMFEAIGDFRKGEEFPPPEAQWLAMVRVIAAVQEHFGLPADAIRFHKEMQATECPGDLDKAKLTRDVSAWRERGGDAIEQNQGDIFALLIDFWKSLVK